MHRALKFDGKEFTHNEENPLPNDVVVLDEFSMVNVQLTLSLLKAVKNGSMLFLVFDHAQLPAIGAGSVAYDLLEYPKYNTSRYTQVHRQSQMSGILSDSNTIRKNKSPIKQYDKSITTGELKDMTYFFRKSQEEINNLAIKYYLGGVEKYGVDNINIITARKDKVLNSAELINKVIQDKINPQIEGQYIMNNYKTIDFRLNDRVIHKVNDRERDVYNGDTGVVVEIGRDYVGDSMQDIMIVDYGMEYNDDGKELGRKLVQYTKSDLDDLRLSYAGTVHSWQGSENKAIIVVLDSSAYVLLDSTMLYTAITRAKERCLLITDVNSFKTCIRENKTIIRNTYLKEFLKEGMNG
jgi:exodeoxyribonuclease V alpha subunit